ncbi:MAG: ABC transporter substrate-binding protein, partial [Chloroflexi bacterium]|nr:ABC transporter substrate-binding protein [Chloroflexota bacterium]
MADTLSRRSILRGALVGGAVAISAACGAVPATPADSGQEG